MLSENRINIGGQRAISGSIGSLDAQLLTIALVNAVMILTNVRALLSKSSLVADAVARSIETKPLYLASKTH